MNETAAVGALTCPVTGNPDLYGLGIRIGIYIQMLTVQLSGLLSCYFQTEDHICQGTVVFVLSTSIVLVRLLNATIQRDTQTPWIEPVEVFPVLSLLLIQVGVCRVSPQNQTTMLIWMVELVGLTVLFAWFWWHGMDLLPRSCPDDKAFFFAEVSIWNWFRSFNKAGSVFTAIGTAMAVFSYCGSKYADTRGLQLAPGASVNANNMHQPSSPTVGSLSSILSREGAMNAQHLPITPTTETTKTTKTKNPSSPCPLLILSSTLAPLSTWRCR